MQDNVIASEYNWNYPILPQKYAHLGLVANKSNIPRGKMFGGSSSLNSMNYYRENEDYFKLWTDIRVLIKFHRFRRSINKLEF